MYVTQGLLADPRPVDAKWSGGFPPAPLGTGSRCESSLEKPPRARLEVLVASEPALIGWLAWLR
jgi:hypothetical protein